MNNSLYYTIGIPASGKSTWAKEQVRKNPKIRRVNKDDLRAMVDAGEWSRDREKTILAIRDAVIEEVLSSGQSVIVDDTNFAPEHPKRFKELAEKHGAELKVKDFTHVPLATCIERDSQRPNSVGEAVIRKMHKQYLFKENSWPPAPPINPKLPSCIISDLDGTLFTRCDRGFFDWDKVGGDHPRHVVADAIRGVLANRSNSKDIIVFMSGRDEICRKETEASLLWEHGFDTELYPLYMRPRGDQRRDSVVKEELYRNHIEGRYNVVAIFDDRAQVNRETWSKLGFSDRLFRVGPIDHDEF